MKKNLAALELHHLLKELNILIDGKVDKVYQFGKKEFLFQFHLRNRGKKLLKISLPNFIYLTDKKEASEKNYGFCSFLRKYLNNSILKDTKQIDFERVIELHFQSKESLILIIELFSKGNIVLCKENYEIIMPLETQLWKNRKIKKGLRYKSPESKTNFLKLEEKELSNLLKETDKDKIVTFLAIDLGLGGIYSEELCLNSNINKDKKPADLEEKDIKNLFDEIRKIQNKKLDPQIIYDDKNNIIDILPFGLNYYKNYQIKKTKNYNESLDQIPLKIKKSRNEIEIEKINEIIEKQRIHIEEIKKDIEENDKKAELIYTKYGLIKNIIGELNEISKRHSWQEIKKKLESHKIIKEVNPKEKTIVVEI